MGTGKKKIEIKKIENERYRRTTFTKRRKGLFKKADQLSAQTGCKIAILTLSGTNKPFFHGDPELLSQVPFWNLDSESLNLLAEVEDDDTDTAKAGAETENAGCSVEIGNGTISLTEESGLEIYGEDDIKELLLLKEALEKLRMLAQADKVMDLGADSAGCHKDAGSSDSDTMMPRKKSKPANPECHLSDDFSSADCFNNKSCKDVELVEYGSSSNVGTIDLNASDELMVTSEEEEFDPLLLKK